MWIMADWSLHRYKFHLDIDGFGWTTRWRSELASGSVILKATLYVSVFGLVGLEENSENGA